MCSSPNKTLMSRQLHSSLRGLEDDFGKSSLTSLKTTKTVGCNRQSKFLLLEAAQTASRLSNQLIGLYNQMNAKTTTITPASRIKRRDGDMLLLPPTPPMSSGYSSARSSSSPSSSSSSSFNNTDELSSDEMLSSIDESSFECSLVRGPLNFDDGETAEDNKYDDKMTPARSIDHVVRTGVKRRRENIKSRVRRETMFGEAAKRAKYSSVVKSLEF